jgi:DNA-binding NarL/FixJ family response regulator
MLHVLLIDDHATTSIGMGMIIKEVVTPAQLHFAGSYLEGLDIVRSYPIELVLLDLSIPDSAETAMIEGLKKQNKNLKILIFSGRDELLNAPVYLSSGADGYLSKNSSTDEMKGALSAILRNETYVSASVRNQIFENYLNNVKPVNSPIERLSPREKQVFELLMTGKWTKEIAETLDVKYSTVSTQKGIIFKKFGVDNVVDLVKKVMRITNEI